MDLRANVMITQFIECMPDDYGKYPRLVHHLKEFSDGSKVCLKKKMYFAAAATLLSVSLLCCLPSPYTLHSPYDRAAFVLRSF
jgi:hypothetical protein